ncbi:unnamed protein product [Scytosiphon promiscuus]
MKVVSGRPTGPVLQLPRLLSRPKHKSRRPSTSSSTRSSRAT